MLVSLSVLLLCFAAQFVFAGSETGFVSWNTLKVSHRAGQGSVLARWAVYLMDRRDELLAAVLIGNNVFIVGSTIAFLDVFERLQHVVPGGLQWLPSPEHLILTPLVVIFCDMLPKSLFRIYSFRLTIRAVPALMMTYFLTLPFALVFSRAAALLGRTGGRSNPSFQAKSREEMVLVAMEGARRGTLFEGVDSSIRSILRLNEQTMAELADKPDALPGSAVLVTQASTVAEAARQLEAATGDELVLVDRDGGGVIGWVTVLELLRADPRALVAGLAHKLPVVDGDRPVVQCLETQGSAESRYLRADGEGHDVVVDRLSVIKTLFTDMGLSAPEGSGAEYA